jgi:hypothetical protein
MIALLYIPIALLMGRINAYLVNTWVDWSKGRRIKHFWNGLINCAGAVVVWIFSDWHTGLAVFPIARIFFNTAYNYFRRPRQPIDYVSSNPKSIVDKVEQYFFKKDGITPLILYVAMAAILILA